MTDELRLFTVPAVGESLFVAAFEAAEDDRQKTGQYPDVVRRVQIFMHVVGQSGMTFHEEVETVAAIEMRLVALAHYVFDNQGRGFALEITKQGYVPTDPVIVRAAASVGLLASANSRSGQLRFDKEAIELAALILSIADGRA